MSDSNEQEYGSDVPSELESGSENEGQLGLPDESGEEDLDDQIAGEYGSEEGGEDMQGDSDDVEEVRDGDSDEIADEGMETNIESKRDDAIKQLISKEDLGIINMRVKETVRILANFKELRDGERCR